MTTGSVAGMQKTVFIDSIEFRATSDVIPCNPPRDACDPLSFSVSAGSYVGGANRMDVMNKKDTYNVRVDVGDTEAPEAALRRFTRQWKQSG